MLVTLIRLLVTSTRSTKSHLIPILVSINLLLPIVLDVALVSCQVFGQSEERQDPPSNNEDNDFAEFEEFDDEVPGGGQPPRQQPPPPESVQSKSNNVQTGLPSSKEVVEDDETIVEEEDDDMIPDEEEVFESIAQPDKIKEKMKSTGELKITRIPAHLRNNWDAYYMEIIMGVGIFVYFVNFITGRSKNESLANHWLEVNQETLEANFSLIGDDGKKEIANHGLVKDSENHFYIWCSGRVGMEGMLAEIKLWKRHDLISVLSKLMKPVTDQVTLRFTLNADAMDNFVFCLSSKRTSTRLVKEYPDINTFCPERKSVDKFGLNADKFVVMNEIGEVPTGLMDLKIVEVLRKYEDLIDYIHISDQYSGVKASDYEATPVKMPEVKKVAIFVLNMSSLRGQTTTDLIEESKVLLLMVMYFVDRVRKLRLSKEGKSKSDKNRQKVEENFLKMTHSQRQEAAQLKREERKRAQKEKILNEDDPDKQRKWEEREYRREMKKKTPKMKQVKVKAM